jgi:hypothetical protein
LKRELLTEPAEAVRRNLQALLLLALYPAEISEPLEERTA